MNYKKKYLKYKLKYLKLKKGGGDSVNNNNLTIPEIEKIEEILKNEETIQNLLLQLGQEELINRNLNYFNKISPEKLEEIIKNQEKNTMEEEFFERVRTSDHRAAAALRAVREQERAVELQDVLRNMNNEPGDYQTDVRGYGQENIN